ncbi:MAG: carbohydrate ABC transporter permease [Acidimicrobiales bacterium]|nr:carbohydrate ABC transporter permease [Acidimicrobiales bacterium]
MAADVVTAEPSVPAPAAADPAARRSTAATVRLVLRYAVLVASAVVILFPVYVTVLNSFLPTDLLVSRPSLFPRSVVFNGYREAWSLGHLQRYLFNSFVQAGLITVGEIVTSVLSGFAFAYLRFPLKRTLFVVFLATLMVPFEVTIITNVATISDLGWTNSYQGLVVPFLATALGTFLLRQAFLGVPRDLGDAASLDGFGHLRFMTRVAVPLIRPAIAALAVFAFLLSWNQYLWPLLITDQDRYRTVQIGLKQLASQNLDKLNMVFAGTVIAAIPIFILLVAFQKQLVRGLTAGAVKG